jgi:hypothetical protein
MKQDKLRLAIFFLWCAFAVITTALICVAPWTRHRDGVPLIDTELVLPAIRAASFVWLPGLTCLAAFWFPKNERRAATQREISKDRVYAALVLTAGFLLYSVLQVAWVTYGVDYANPSNQLPAGTFFLSRMQDVVSDCLKLNSLALAPTHWLASRS